MKSEYKHSDKILISSRSFEKSIAEYGDYSNKIVYYPQWSDASPEVQDVQKFKSLSLPKLPEGFNLMFAGAVGEAHGFECTMQAALLTKDHKDIKWIIVGDGPDFDKIKSVYELSKTSGNINNLVGWLIKGLKEGYSKPVSGKNEKKTEFDDFMQRKYDYAELEREALA